MNELSNIQKQFGDYLFNFINSKVASVDDAKDIYQEVLIKIVTKADQLNKDESLKSWLFMIARNQIIDFYRAQKHQENIDDLVFQPAYDEEYDSAYIQLEGCLAGFVNQLPKEYKQLVMESEINGKSQKELSEDLNINYVTVRSKVQRGRSKIKDMILGACSLEKDKSGRVVNCEPRQDVKSDCNSKTVTCG